MRLIPLTKGKFAKVDDEAFLILSRFRWRPVRTNGQGNFYAAIIRKRKKVYMHHIVFGAQVLIDHKDGDGLNNQRSNLRQATRVQNGWNRKVQRHSSRFKGVSFYRACGNWTAGSKLNGRDIHLGYFPTEQLAAKAYDAFALSHFGEYARTNQSMGLL